MERKICSFDNGWVKYDPETGIYHLLDEETHKEYLFDAAEPHIGQKCCDCYHFNPSMPIATENGWCEYLDHITHPDRYCSDFIAEEN